MHPAPIDPSSLDAQVEGRNLKPGRLRDQLGPGPTLLIFLRHLGCLFCREWLSELQKASLDPTFPATVYVHLGTVEQGDAFFSSLAPQARAVSDPRQTLFKAFGVPRAPVYQLLDPRVWACGLRAQARGHRQTKPVGDPFVMPGLFLVERDQVTWKFIPDHLGGLPPLAAIPRPAVA